MVSETGDWCLCFWSLDRSGRRVFESQQARPRTCRRSSRIEWPPSSSWCCQRSCSAQRSREPPVCKDWNRSHPCRTASRKQSLHTSLNPSSYTDEATKIKSQWSRNGEERMSQNAYCHCLGCCVELNDVHLTASTPHFAAPRWSSPTLEVDLKFERKWSVT